MSKHKHPLPDRRPAQRWMERASYIGVSLGILLILVVCYFEFFAPDVIPPLPQQLAAPAEPAEPKDQDQLAGKEGAGQQQPPAEPAATRPEDEENPDLLQGVVAQGDTAGGILQEWLSLNEVHALSEACKGVFPLTKLRAGQPYSVLMEKGVFSRFEYEIDGNHKLLVTRDPDGDASKSACWITNLQEIEYDIRLIKVEGAIDSSLFNTMSGLGESATLAVRLAEVFAWEINFIRDIQPGDSFRVLVEKRYRDGEFKGYGKMLIAEFTNKGKVFEAFLFQDSFGNQTYFNAAGESLKRAFLKAPLSFTRISSRFDLRRLHPIFKTVRPHPAVDYAAPSGTPVKAIGSGTVDFRGYNKGAGNYITLKHNGGYESMYLHLSGFAKNLKKGGRVRQGETIGYVGSTGYSTGPHLDFRMKKNGQFVNPEKILSPRDESVPKNKLAAFKAERDIWRRYMEGEIALSEYGREKETTLQ